VWGLGLATKHNAVFWLPTALLAFVLWKAHRWFSMDGRLSFPVPRRAWLIVPIGLLVLLLFYPYGWHAPWSRLAAYYRFHLHHEHYPVDYLNTLYVAPPFPWHVPWVLTAATLPVSTLVLGCAGLLFFAATAGHGLRMARYQIAVPQAAQQVVWLTLAFALAPLVIIGLPSVPIFGGTKHWMPALPFVCVAAAYALVRGWCTLVRQSWRQPGLGRVLATALALMCVVYPVQETARTHPYGHTYYSDLIGGHAGAVRWGFARTYWGGEGRGLLDTLNREARRGARVFTDRMNRSSFRAYKRDGLLRNDLRWVAHVTQADWALINHQREYRDFAHAAREASVHGHAVAAIDFDGVPIVSLYALRAGGDATREAPASRQPNPPP